MSNTIIDKNSIPEQHFFEPTHCVTVEVHFKVKIDVKATSEEEAEEKALEEAKKEYEPMANNCMADAPRDMIFWVLWTDEYED